MREADLRLDERRDRALIGRDSSRLGTQSGGVRVRYGILGWKEPLSDSKASLSLARSRICLWRALRGRAAIRGVRILGT